MFTWTTFDVRSLLPTGWDEDITRVAVNLSRRRLIRPPHITTREDKEVTELFIRGTSAQVVREELPWLVKCYEGVFRDLAQSSRSEPVSIAEGQRHTIVLNVQRAEDARYECHVDTNPIQGMLYVTSHPEGGGGELVVANDSSAMSVDGIESNCSMIYPQRGHLMFFDGRKNPHYVRPLLDPHAIRVAVAMNFYVPSGPESLRPPDLDDYLFGTPLEA